MNIYPKASPSRDRQLDLFQWDRERELRRRGGKPVLRVRVRRPRTKTPKKTKKPDAEPLTSQVTSQRRADMSAGKPVAAPVHHPDPYFDEAGHFIHYCWCGKWGSVSVASHAQTSWVCFTVLSTDQKLIGWPNLPNLPPSERWPSPTCKS